MKYIFVKIRTREGGAELRSAKPGTLSANSLARTARAGVRFAERKDLFVDKCGRQIGCPDGKWYI
jgi:hypothetical protein